MDTEKWLTDTRRVVRVGLNSLAVNIKKDIADALDIKKGSLVEVKIRNTGKTVEPDIRQKKKETPETPEIPNEDYTPAEEL